MTSARFLSCAALSLLSLTLHLDLASATSAEPDLFVPVQALACGVEGRLATSPAGNRVAAVAKRPTNGLAICEFELPSLTLVSSSPLYEGRLNEFRVGFNTHISYSFDGELIFLRGQDGGETRWVAYDPIGKRGWWAPHGWLLVHPSEPSFITSVETETPDAAGNWGTLSTYMYKMQKEKWEFTLGHKGNYPRGVRRLTGEGAFVDDRRLLMQQSGRPNDLICLEFPEFREVERATLVADWALGPRRDVLVASFSTLAFSDVYSVGPYELREARHPTKAANGNWRLNSSDSWIVGFSPDGEILLTGKEDTLSAVSLEDSAKSRVVRLGGSALNSQELSLTRNGKLIVRRIGRDLEVYDTELLFQKLK
jgi:hypothetical protein